jgi:hypothetical protein
MARGMIPTCDPSLHDVPMVYVFPEPVYGNEKKSLDLEK